MKAQTIIPATIISSFPVQTLADAPNHLSCDGIDNGVTSMKVFAWDGVDKGWAYDDATVAGIIPMSYQSTNLISSPEIALVSANNGACLYAIIAYNVANGSGSMDAYVEYHSWNPPPLSYWSLVSAGIIPGTTATSRRVINVAGDEYGHFAILFGNENQNYSATSIGQWVGYIDNSCGLQLGTPGNITRNNYDMSEPDVDITFDNSVNAAPYDGNIYLTFVTKLGYSIMAADVQMRDLVNGGTLDIMTNNNDIAEVPNQYFGIASHPSISVNDGFQAANGNYIPHAAVAYQLEFNNGTSPSTQSIYLFGVTPRTYTLTSTLVNTPATPGVTNQHPTVVTRPTDVASVTAWDYYGPALHPWNDNEGLAHTATYDLATNTFDPGYSGDMQVQTAKFPNNGTGFGNTKLTTASGFSGAQLLYFYYYHDLVNSALTIEYKTRNYFNTFLRSSINEAVNGLTIYPNPVSSIITINSNDNLTTSELTDVTGRVFTTLKGDKKELEAGLNKNISTLPTGVYFLKFTKEDGQSVVTKFLKQ